MWLRKRGEALAVPPDHARSLEERADELYLTTEQHSRVPAVVRLGAAGVTTGIVFVLLRAIDNLGITLACAAGTIGLALIGERVREARRRRRLLEAARPLGLTCSTCGDLLSLPRPRASDLLGEDIWIQDKPRDHVLATGRCPR
jgi:hypothetical protein